MYFDIFLDLRMLLLLTRKMILFLKFVFFCVSMSFKAEKCKCSFKNSLTNSLKKDC